MNVRDKYYWQSTDGWRLVEICDRPRVVENRLQVRIRDVASGEYHTLHDYELRPVPEPGVLDSVK